jgi:hypothetical protein
MLTCLIWESFNLMICDSYMLINHTDKYCDLFKTARRF